MDISLYTSLYRTEAYLPTYLERALRTIEVLRAAGLTLELVMIANDASDAERALLARLQDAYEHVQVMYVPREPLYLSWNRGIKAARANVLAPWNVDDYYYPEALITGHERITAGGCDIVYFSREIVWTQPQKQRVVVQPAPPYDAQAHRNKMLVGPFPMFSRRIYDAVGGFDGRFRLLGDYDFFVRATRHTDFCPMDQVGGQFVIHGGNLSSSGNPREWAETNIIHLLHDNHAALRPCPPDAMRATFNDFADAITLTPQLEDRLWGAEAERIWQEHLTRQRRNRIDNAVRYVPRRIIERLGLRGALYRAGLLKTPPRK